MRTIDRRPTDPLVLQLRRMEEILRGCITAYRRQQRWYRQGDANGWDVYIARETVRWAVAQVRAQRLYLVTIGRRAA